jgi:hypothetical protein
VEKGQAEITGFVFVTLLTVIGITIVLSIGLPLIDEAREHGIIGEARHNMEIIDNLILSVAAGGTGTLKTAQINVNGGTYRVDSDSGSFSFELPLKTGTLPRGTFKKDGTMTTIIGGSASATQNASYLKLENEILEVVFGRVGSEASFMSINTSTLIKTIRSKVDAKTTVLPDDMRINLDGLDNTAWGLGYSKLAFEGENMPSASVLAHVRPAQGAEYEILYTLPASADFLIIEVRNASQNKTTFSYAYKLGASANGDVIRVGASNIPFAQGSSPLPACNTTQNMSFLFICSHDLSELSGTKSSGIIYADRPDSFLSICNDFAYSGYRFNITSNGPLRVIVPLSNANCASVGNQTAAVSRLGIPISPFSNYPLSGEGKIEMKLQYDRIKLSGTENWGTGFHKICIKKVGRQGSVALVDVRSC